MNGAISSSLITDPQDLQYISDVVNQVLDSPHELGSIKDVQTALKQLSLERGREIQMNLVSDQNLLFGFNFSFKNDPSKTTPTIAFKQQLDLAEIGSSEIVQHLPLTKSIEIATKTEGNLSKTSPKGELTISPALQAESLYIPSENNAEFSELFNFSLLGLGKMNPSLAFFADKLVSRQEIDGLVLTGATLKAATILAKFLETEDKLDTQSAGNAVIKRFQQVLPEQFDQLKAGSSPKPFNWKDPHSGKQYRFEFEAAQSLEGNLLSPVLKGFEQVSGASDSLQPVFSAHLIDAKRERWNIEQCEFNSAQLGSLTAAERPNRSHPPSEKSLALSNKGVAAEL